MLNSVKLTIVTDTDRDTNGTTHNAKMRCCYCTKIFAVSHLMTRLGAEQAVILEYLTHLQKNHRNG